MSWLALLLALAACDGADPAVPTSAPTEPRLEATASVEVVNAEYVTSRACRGCHPTEVDAWKGSDHDRAMEMATADTVLADFEDTSFDAGGETWRFFRREDAFLVNTVGPDGTRADFEVLHTFGVDPLQQYLVAISGGRLQALTVAWDTRSADVGGQRWFSLYPDEISQPGDVMHWTGIANRWNSMCAHCHSTNVRKDFDLESKRYDTRWSEIDVSCEACHGPASLHVRWAESGADPARERGFAWSLGVEPDARWTMNPETGIALRVPPRDDDREIETCSGCHSRRALIREGSVDPRFLDRYVPVLLEEGLYFADGQIQDEVYVYGSFLQSRMHRAGVRCGDCHEPHSLALRDSGNALCAGCHAPSVFGVRSHHQHPENSAGAECVECHMPSRTYMIIDERRDHSFRIPRPDLTREIGSPNACTGCHTDRSAQWAADEIAGWPAAAAETPAHYGQALQAGRLGTPGAPEKLQELAAQLGSPSIARASAVSLLARYPGAGLVDAIRDATSDAEPLIRLAGARAVDSLPIDQRIGLVGRLVLDPVRAVRIEAARSLAGADPERLGGHLTRARGPALAEYRHSQELDADRPTSHVNLALLASSMGNTIEAEAHYRRALEVGSYFLPAYVNLADLLRREGREEEGEQLLRRGLLVEPDSAELHHALGLLQVRLGQSEEAMGSLAHANRLAPEDARYAYVLGVALYSEGEVEGALETLRQAHVHHPMDRNILEGLASISREAGHLDDSVVYLKKLRNLSEGAIQP